MLPIKTVSSVSISALETMFFFISPILSVVGRYNNCWPKSESKNAALNPSLRMLFAKYFIRVVLPLLKPKPLI